MARRNTSLSMSQVNSLNYEEFIEVFGNVIEHCSLVAAAVVRCSPFRSLQHLHDEISTFIDQLPEAGKEGILRSHPDLAGRVAMAGQLTKESQKEQKSAELGDMTEEERNLMGRLNSSYRLKFGFPFVICARMNKKDAILKGLEARLQNSAQTELLTGIAEVKKIALLRLKDLITDEMDSTGSPSFTSDPISSNL